MKRPRIGTSALIVIATASAAALLSASAANADSPSFFTLSATSVPAGGTVLISSDGWGDGATDGTTVINFETPAPPVVSTPSGGIGSGGSMGTNGGTTIVSKEIPASAGPWTYTLTIPATTPPGDGYNICLSVQGYLSMGDGGCVALAVTAPSVNAAGGAGTASGTSGHGPTVTLDRSVTTPGSRLGFAGTGFTVGEKVDVIVHSVAVQLTTVTADANGAVSGSVTVPTGLALGGHTLELKGERSGVDVLSAFTVGGVPTAATDVVVAPRVRPAMWLGGALAVLGLAAAGGVVWRRLHAAA